MTRPIIPGNVRVRPPALIAHRGYALRYPENTLESFTAAIAAGARYIEFDIQLTADGIPVVMHDADFWRTARVDKSVMDLTLDQVKDIWVTETERFGPEFRDVVVPTLAQTVALIQKHPALTAFVEIKVESVRRFGTDHVVERVMDAIEPALSQCAVISFDPENIKNARRRGASAIGWVLPEWSPAARELALQMLPEYLFCNYRMIPDDDELWRGSWSWALYEIVEPELALELAARGARFIETMAIGEMLADPRLAAGR